MCADRESKLRQYALEAGALSEPMQLRISRESHLYHDQFIVSVRTIAAKLGGHVDRHPETWPGGTVVPLELNFEYDYRKPTLREKFTLVRTSLRSYSEYIASADHMSHGGGAYVQRPL